MIARVMDSFGQFVTVVTCDNCGAEIDDVSMGAVVYEDPQPGQNDPRPVMHAHKGRCLDKIERDRSAQGPLLWQELLQHINDIVRDSGLTIAGVIKREVVWSGGLDDRQQAELARKLSELGKWLQDIGKHSPLWAVEAE
jgi:hypothetical protein